MWYTILITLVVDIGGLIVLYALLRDRVRRATTAEAQIGEIREEVSRLLVELNQTTDRNILLMEDRIGSLNELLAAADKKIGLLHREIEKHDVGARIYSRLAQPRASAPGTAAGAAMDAEDGLAEAAAAPRPRRMQKETGVPDGQSSPRQGAARQDAPRQGAARQDSPRRAPPVPPSDRQDAPRQGAARQVPPEPPSDRQPLPLQAPARPAPAGEPAESQPLAVELAERAEGRAGPRRAEPPRDPAEELQQRVLMLHRAGFSASLIAGRVGAPVGEVELIIGLEERKLAGS